MNQSCKPARIVVVDDGSGDATASVARQLGAEVIQRPNGGASAARNTGVAAVDTPWIAFLDADDAWEPYTLERFVAAIKACPDVVAAFGDYALDDAGAYRSSCFANDRHFARLRREQVAPGVTRCEPRSLISAFVRSMRFVSTSSLAIRRDAFLAHGGFDDQLPIAEDFDLNLRLFAAPTAIIDDVLSTYFRHGANLSDDAAANIAYEDLVLERVIAHPERYPARLEALLRAQRPRRFNDAGIYALRCGRFVDARRWFARSWSADRSARAAAGIILSSLLNNPPGRRMHGMLRRAWQARHHQAGPAT